MGQRKKIKGEIRQYFELNDNENAAQQNLSDATKAVFEGHL